MTTSFNRRHALAGAATVGLGLPVLAACGADGPTTADLVTDPTPAASSTVPSESAPASAGTDATLATTDDILVGGGTIFPDQQVVVTQPTAGDFRCFSAVCTHQGCIVSSVSYGTIRCECHGSAYSIEDGSVLNPPATVSLAEKQITVEDGRITLA